MSTDEYVQEAREIVEDAEVNVCTARRFYIVRGGLFGLGLTLVGLGLAVGGVTTAYFGWSLAGPGVVLVVAVGISLIVASERKTWPDLPQARAEVGGQLLEGVELARELGELVVRRRQLALLDGGDGRGDLRVPVGVLAGHEP